MTPDTQKQSQQPNTEEKEATTLTQECSFSNAISQSLFQQDETPVEVEQEPENIERMPRDTKKLDFVSYFSQMLLDEKTPAYKGEVSIFKKKQNLNIALLQTRSPHI